MFSVSAPIPAFQPSAPARNSRILAVASAHLLFGWALLHLGVLPAVVAPSEPLMVALLANSPAPNPVPAVAAAAELPRAAPRLLPSLPPPAAPPLATSVEPAAAPSAPASFAPAAPAAAAAPASAPRATEPPSPPPVPPPRPRLSADDVRYRVLPPAEVPLASRRAGESGTVWLRVAVDAAGAPAQVALHRSSGFERLDRQALWAMGQARFSPHAVDGRAVEVEVIAPIEYPAAP
jgi:protein TonB